jgi:hypothetical protein
MLAGAGSASATTCYSSTPNSTTYSDSPVDGDYGLAPEITAGNVSLDAGCNLTVSYSIGNAASMVDGDFVGWFIDADNSAATGVPSGFAGADYALGRLPSGFSVLSRYNAATDSFDYLKDAVPAGAFGVRTNIGDFESPTSATFTFAGAASWDGAYDSYYDFAPEPGSPAVPFGVQFSSAAPAPPPPPPPPAPVQPQTVNTPADLPACRVPILRGLGVAQARRRLNRANCSIGNVRRVRSRKLIGLVLRSNPAARSVLANNARVTVMVGKRAGRRLRKASASTSRTRVISALNELSGTR